MARQPGAKTTRPLRPWPHPWNRIIPVAQKLLVWGLFFAVLWFLRDFFFLVFVTFVFSYLMNHGVVRLERRIPRRRLRVALVFLALLAVITGLGLTIGPRMIQQAQKFRTDIPTYLDKLQAEVEQARHGEGMLATLIPEEFDIQGLLKETLPLVLFIARSTLTVGSSFLLALFFSLLIILDYPNLRQGTARLENTRLHAVYLEVAPSIRQFAMVLGRALEAQLLIATCNTVLTAIGLAFLGLPNLAFLSAVVFVCSFIPVAGVFISSVPICLAALTFSGLPLMLGSIAFIIGVHMVEGYILNPRIYGAHLKMNPVLVLAILVISHHMFGVWGLILGIPITTYFYRHVILAPAAAPPPA